MDQMIFNTFNLRIIQILCLFIILGSFEDVNAQTSPNTSKTLDMPNLWKAKDLLQPADLALTLRNSKAKRPVIYNIGVVEDIESANNLGAASKVVNLDKLKQNLKNLPKSTVVVIYCGCCPFEKCPNIRPAFSLMKKMGFTNGKLLNIPVNLKQDWINKGYPMLSKN
ncbi:rhodanese-like domain-containing protein [Daejeonella sp.]|uniref:rhodanese-like domain-containing protein n=1 Tax=Daejeonella sp. TaxID=2805397 RepID=UPI0039833520